METTMRLAFVPVLLLAVLLPRSAAACASCGCGDPTLTVMGAEKPFAGRVRLSLEAGTADVGQGRPGWTELRTRDSRLDLGASWAVLDRLVLAARVPLVHREIARPDLSRATSAGLGDAELTARFLAWQDRPLFPHTLLQVIGGLKLPTAWRRSDAAGPLVPELQAGTGSFDPLGGVALSLFQEKLSAYASALAFVPTTGFDGMRAGTGLRAALTGQWQVAPWIAPRLGLDLRAEQQGTIRGAPEADTGGTVLYASPGLVVSPATDLVLQLAARLPVATDLVGAQRVGPLFSLGVVHDF
jgi:hypothetical protein